MNNQINQINKVDKIIGIFSYYIAPLGLAMMLFFGSNEMFFDQIDLLTLILFTFTLLAKPLAVIFKMDFFWKIVHLRKELGVLVFWLFSSHLAGMLFFGAMMSNMYWGILAGICLFIMAVACNNYIGKLLKVDWSKLRFLSFLTFLFMLLHVGTQEGKIKEVLLVFLVFVVLKIIEFWKLKKMNESKKPTE